MPIFTFIDTPGAWAGVEAEKLGQGEAIAYNYYQKNIPKKVCIIATFFAQIQLFN